MIEQQTAQLTPHAEARPNLDVRITREHIEDGVQDGMTDCPLALALTAAGDDELDVMRAEVAAGEIRLITRSRMDTRATTYHLSPTVRKLAERIRRRTGRRRHRTGVHAGTRRPVADRPGRRGDTGITRPQPDLEGKNP